MTILKEKIWKLFLFTIFFFFFCPQEAASVGSRKREEGLVNTVQEAHMTLLLSLHKRYSPEFTALTQPEEAFSRRKKIR